MRVTRYVRADTEGNWMAINIRCSCHVSYDRLNRLMRQNGWIRWKEVRDYFNKLRKKISAADPIKYPNWKEVKIPMLKGGIKDLPPLIQQENENKNMEVIPEAADAAN